MKKLIKKYLNHVYNKIEPRLIAKLEPKILQRLSRELLEKGTPELLFKKNLFIPNLNNLNKDIVFMESSTCSATDFYHPDYHRICQMIREKPGLHRKQWEYVYIVYKLMENGVLGEGKRGLGFGVGNEPLPAVFAAMGSDIVATDAPENIKTYYGKTKHVSELRFQEIIDEKEFLERVSFKGCDMNNISGEFKDFDFCWSSCCFEHLGDLDKGIEFVVNSVEKTLKIGGFACHTTEFNLSSNDDTVKEGPTVLYRKRDMDKLVDILKKRGHKVSELKIANNQHPLDFYVDHPPFSEPHLKLAISNYVCTSIGLVIQRGK